MDGWLSNRTLDEVAWLDREQVLQILKSSKVHGPFCRVREVDRFVFKAVHASLQKLGVEIHAGMDPKMADRILQTKKIRMETRRYAEPEMRNESGIYIYKGSLNDGSLEMAYWISLARKARHRLLIGGPKYWIWTNAPV